ncbi:hypothetical protein [Micromonospora sp. NPDC023956]|uniref:hypothetical protein n=1 Tax=Micromonospora sp. NPDC023956 TaxID=3155722 RepID=UPI0033C59D34
MPAPVSLDDNRVSSRLTLLFRAGLAAAALAALLLLVADGNGLLRVAAVLAITAVAMIGLSIALRPNAAAEVRQLADEVDELRAELAAVAHSARPAAEPARWSAEPAGGRIDEGAPAPVTGPRAGRARVAVADAAGADPIRTAADEPEPEDTRRDHGPRPAAPTDHRSTGSAPGRRRAGDPEEDDRRPADPEEDDRRRVGEPQGGRRRAVDQEDGRRRSAEPATGRRRAAEPDGEPYRDHRADGDWYADQEPANRPRAASGYAAGRATGGVYGGPSRSDGPDVRPGAAPGPEVPRPVGVVRHTETVHVTTRHTIVDGTAPDPGSGDGYGRWTPPEEQPWTGHAPERADRWDGYPAREEHGRSGRSRGSARPGPPPEHHDRSWDAPPTGSGPAGARPWSGPDDRSGSAGARDWPGPGGAPDPDWRAPAGGRYGVADERYGSPGGERTGQAGGDGRSRRGAAERPGPARTYPAADAGADDWSEVRAGGRWATVRDDEHGREVRMGERRAAVHADDDGTELRMEDHWAAVRRSRRGHPDDGYHRDEPGRGGGREYPRGDHRPDPDRALPPGGVPVPEQWRPARSGRPADPGPTPHGSGPAPGWSARRGGRQTDDWPEPSPRARRSEPDPDRYGRSPRRYEERADDSPERWR